MGLFSDRVSHQKMALYLKTLIFSNFFENFSASGFAILSELGLKVVELNSELHSASNDSIFDQDRREKIFHSHLLIPPNLTLIENNTIRFRIKFYT